MMWATAPKRQRTLAKRMGEAGLGTKELKVKEWDEAMDAVDMSELAEFSQLHPQVVETMRRVWKASYLVYMF